MPRVKIVAIAKDEGAYLAEWIFHHLYFGFSAIDIYINRTTDNSTDVINKIAKKNPNVNCFNADWVDTIHKDVSSRLQKIIYSMALNDEKNIKEFSHILFIDIDEYWTPNDFTTSINDFIEKLPKNHISCSFRWFNAAGDSSDFAHLPNSIKGQKHPLVKTLCSTKVKVSEIRLHIPLYPKPIRKNSYMPDGTSFRGSLKFPQQIHPSLRAKSFDVNIIHRMNRSQTEYISMLYRGNPENSDMIKLNRNGWLSPDDQEGETQLDKLDINIINKEIYNQQKEIFFKDIEISTELQNSQLFVLNRYKKVKLELPKFMKNKNTANKTRKAFNGISNSDVVEIINEKYQ